MDSLPELLGRLRDRDDDAAREIWEKFFPSTVRYARSRLDDQPGSPLDDEDIASRALASLLFALRGGKYANVQDDHAFRLMIVHIVRRFVSDGLRWHRCQRVELESALGSEGLGSEGLDSLEGPEPPADRAAYLNDECRWLLNMLRQDYREVAWRRLQCKSIAQIAADCGCHISTVRRKLRIIRELWEKRLLADTSTHRERLSGV
ncbi:MAG: hypothetical protein KDB14_23560 [Planctomycetales bacterium]|nr:hypothetical protein [Planctomycetales bacterium]